MRIGLLTFTDGTNYGQRLQNYALQEVLKKEGHEVLTIKQKHFYSKKHLLKEIAKGMIYVEQKNAELERQKSFDRFNERYISFYEDEIYEDCPYDLNLNNFFDIFVAGSDQVWNPNSPFVNSNFFLQFADKLKRATYAPSFSVDIIPEKNINNFSSWISEIPALSAREIRGISIIRELTGKNAQLVLDPTLLLTLEDWTAICKRPSSNFVSNSPYILTLFLGNEFSDEVRYIQKKTKLIVLRLEDYYSLAPDEFLWILMNSSLVLTDSYHVSIFSMIFKRPYIVFERKTNGASMSSRFETLNYYFDIQNRFWNNIKCYDELWLRYEGKYFEDRIERLRDISLRYIHNNILKSNF